MECVDVRDERIIKTNDDVSLPQSCGKGRTFGFDRNDKQSGINRQVVIAHDSPVDLHVLTADAEVAAADSAIFDEPARDIFRRINADGKAKALRWEDDGSVDSDHLAT